MTPETESLAAVVARCRQRVMNALGPPAPNEQNVNVVTFLVRPRVVEAFDAWDQIPLAVHEFAAKLATIRSNTRLAPAAKADDIEALVGSTQATLDGLTGTMGTAIGAALATAARYTGVPRPQPVNADQYAALAALHDKWKMVLDRLPSDDVRPRTVEFLRDALAREDELAVWALAADDWPTLYAEGRGVEHELLAISIDEVVAPHLPKNATEARRITRAMVDGYGLRAAHQTAGAYVSIALDVLVNNPRLAGFAQ